MPRPGSLERRQQPFASSALAALAKGNCVVGIGTSAGGLGACQHLFSALPATPGMACWLKSITST